MECWRTEELLDCSFGIRSRNGVSVSVAVLLTGVVGHGGYFKEGPC